MNELKRTPLYPVYKQYGGKTVEFGGWDMPVQFQGIIAEHEAVRQRAGLFDVSHMGEFDVTGADARALLQSIVTNDLGKLTPGRAMYTPMCYENGGTVDDLLIYCLSDNHFWVVVNAGNIDKDFDWMSGHSAGRDVVLKNISPEIALLALQGPLAVSILSKLTQVPLDEVAYYRFVDGFVAGMKAVISRTGYTGEDGFELYIQSSDAVRMWEAILEVGKPAGLVPCGLGARDTLRLEAKLPLYGHELEADISPLEAGLGFAVKLDKVDFIGRDALVSQKSGGLNRKVVGLEVLDRGIPRAGYEVVHEGRSIGAITSGTMSPTLKKPIALALVEVEAAALDTELSVTIRDKQVAARVVKTPFYRRPQA
jgi:aminomethyltransferase